MSESGSKAYTLTQSGSHVSGGYTIADLGTDGYTLTENGTDSSGGYGNSLSGDDNYTLAETGSELSGAFSRTTTGSGTGVLGETGYPADLPYNSTPSTGYSLVESGNYLAGSLSLSETGLDRNGLLQHFTDPSNATAANGPGMVDYSPVGAPVHVRGAAAAYSGPGITGQLNAAATDAAFNDLGLGLLHEYCWAGEQVFPLASGEELPIRSAREGLEIISASEHDPEGPRHHTAIGNFFRNRPAHVINLIVEDQVFRPTSNHGIYVRDRGFVAAGDLRPGDELLTDDHRWVKVASIVDHGEILPVFNLMVPNDHTYFVGSKRNGGFCILVHNESAAQKLNAGGIEGYRQGDKVFITGIAGQRFGPKDLYDDAQVPLQLRLAIEDVLAGRPGVGIHYHGAVTDSNGTPRAEYTIVRSNPNEVGRGGSAETKNVTGPASSADYTGIRNRQRQDADETDRMVGRVIQGMETLEKAGDIADAAKGMPGLKKGVKEGAEFGVKKGAPKVFKYVKKAMKMVDDAVNGPTPGAMPSSRQKGKSRAAEAPASKKKTKWQYATEHHDKRATELFGDGKGRTAGGRNYDKRYKKKDIEYKSDNFSNGPRTSEEIKRMDRQIDKDIRNKKEGIADPHWHVEHDPRQDEQMKPLLKKLEDAGIGWTYGHGKPF